MCWSVNSIRQHPSASYIPTSDDRVIYLTAAKDYLKGFKSSRDLEKNFGPKFRDAKTRKEQKNAEIKALLQSILKENGFENHESPVIGKLLDFILEDMELKSRPRYGRGGPDNWLDKRSKIQFGDE